MDVWNNLYYNVENDWILSEVRVFTANDMVYVSLQVIDCKTRKLVDEYIDDVWVYDWHKLY